MPEFCPKCGNMVADGVERCPACGARVQPRVMDERSGFTWTDFLNYTLFMLLFLLAAIGLPAVTAMLCLHLIVR